MPVGRRSSVWTSHSCSSLRRTVSPAPPSNSTLSGTTTAARPLIFSSVLMCWTKLSCLLRRRGPEVLADDGQVLALLLALRVDDHARSTSCRTADWSAPCRSASPGSARQAVVLVDGRLRVVAVGPMPCRKRFMAHSRTTLSTMSMPRSASSLQVPLAGPGRGARCCRRCSRGRPAGSRRCRRPDRRSSRRAAGA